MGDLDSMPVLLGIDCGTTATKAVLIDSAGHPSLRRNEPRSGGIARAMTIGMERILGLVTAVEAYLGPDVDTVRSERAGIVADLAAGLQDLPHTIVQPVPDEAGHPAGCPVPRWGRPWDSPRST